MNKKLIVTGTVCAALLCTAAFAAPASNTDSAPAAPAVTAPAVDPSVPLDAPTAMPEEAIPYSIGIKATVTEVLKSESGASIEVKPEDGETIVLNVSDKTILLDNQKAIPVSIEDIKAGDTIYAYHDLMMTRSIPAQTPALAILTNLGDGAIAKLHMPEQMSIADGKASMLCDNGSIWVRTTEETEFQPYMTKMLVRAENLRIGQPFLAWYDIVMESFPAQANATRILLPAMNAEERELTFTLDGDMVIGAKMVDGVPVVPVRPTAEALGMKVGYRKDGNNAYITLSSESGELSMTLGQDAYSYAASASGKEGATAPLSYGAAPFTAPYFETPSTWMSAEAFQLLGYDVALRHDALSITKR